MTVRKLLFWMHLTLGVSAGTVILIMAVTGVLLMYERQITAWADRDYRVTRTPHAKRLPIETLIRGFRGVPATLTLRSDPSAPVEAVFGRGPVVYADPYTGRILGEGSKGVRAAFRGITDWHRWLGASGESRGAGKAVTGASNLAFLALILSGFYLWLPKVWTYRHVKPVLFFRGSLAGKARDFNWHNVIGVWCAVPLFLIVVGGAAISYPWLTGTSTPASPGPAPAQPSSRIDFTGLDAALLTAERHVASWQTIAVRVPPNNGAPWSFTIDQAHRGRPDKRSVLSIDRVRGEIVRVEDFAGYNFGRKVRSWLRWIHTGEAGGVAGQTLAGMASAGAVLLVWTGLALALRRLRAWRARMLVKREERPSLASARSR